MSVNDWDVMAETDGEAYRKNMVHVWPQSASKIPVPVLTKNMAWPNIHSKGPPQAFTHLGHSIRAREKLNL